jgi:hypothetical protein
MKGGCENSDLERPRAGEGKQKLTEIGTAWGRWPNYILASRHRHANQCVGIPNTSTTTTTNTTTAAAAAAASSSSSNGSSNVYVTYLQLLAVDKGNTD